MRAFPVRLPAGARYWTVLDEDLAVVAVADSFLRQVRFGRGGAESMTKAYADSIALFLRLSDWTEDPAVASIARVPLLLALLCSLAVDFPDGEARPAFPWRDAGRGTGARSTGDV
jgi:hypothetical protein